MVGGGIKNRCKTIAGCCPKGELKWRKITFSQWSNSVWGSTSTSEYHLNTVRPPFCIFQTFLGLFTVFFLILSRKDVETLKKIILTRELWHSAHWLVEINNKPPVLPFIQVDNISSFIAHDLSFNVPRLEDQLLDENAAIAKRFLGFRPKQSNQKC